MSVAHAVFPPASRTLRQARRCRRQPLPPQRQHLESRHLLPTRIRILPRLPPAHTTLILRLDATPGLSFAALRAQLWLARRGFDGRASAPVLKTTTFCLLLVEYSLPCRCKSSRPYLRALCFRGGCTLRCAPEWTTANDSENSDSLAEKSPTEMPEATHLHADSHILSVASLSSTMSAHRISARFGFIALGALHTASSIASTKLFAGR